MFTLANIAQLRPKEMIVHLEGSGEAEDQKEDVEA